jgi:hypothetical protein
LFILTRVTTAAPLGPTQPARTTPAAQTTALASLVSAVIVAAKPAMASKMMKNERMLDSLLSLRLRLHRKKRTKHHPESTAWKESINTAKIMN